MLHQHLELQRLRSVGEGRAVGSTPRHDSQPFSIRRHRDCLLENRNDSKLAACILRIVVIDIRLDIALERRFVEKFLGHDHIGLLLIETKGMLDRVASGQNRILLSLASIHVAACLFAQPVRFVDQCLENRHRIGQFVLRLARGRERISSGRIELDPIRPVFHLVAHCRARFFYRTHHRAGQGIIRRGRVRRFRSPNDAQRRYLVPRPIDPPLIDCVADRNIAVPVSVGGHIARRGEARAQIRLHVRNGDGHRLFRRHVWLARIEHMRMPVDQPGQDCRLAQINHLRSRRYLHLTFGAHIRDLLAREHDHLLRQHCAVLAVE